MTDRIAWIGTAELARYRTYLAQPHQNSTTFGRIIENCTLGQVGTISLAQARAIGRLMAWAELAATLACPPSGRCSSTRMRTYWSSAALSRASAIVATHTTSKSVRT